MSTFVHTTVTAEVRRLRATRSTTISLLVVFAFAALIAVATVLLAGHQQNGPLTELTLDNAVRAPAKVLGFVQPAHDPIFDDSQSLRLGD